MPRNGKGRSYGGGGGVPNAPDGQPQPTGGEGGVPRIDAPADTYGDRSKLIASQQAAPPGGQPSPQAPTPGLGAALEKAQLGLGVPVGIGAPTANPGQPVTSGAPLGPGPGLEAIRPTKNHAATVLEQLAAATDDPHLFEMALRMRERGA